MYSGVKREPAPAPCKMCTVGILDFFPPLSQETHVSIGKAGQGRTGRFTLWFTFLLQAAKTPFFTTRVYRQINRFLPPSTLRWWLFSLAARPCTSRRVCGLRRPMETHFVPMSKAGAGFASPVCLLAHPYPSPRGSCRGSGAGTTAPLGPGLRSLPTRSSLACCPRAREEMAQRLSPLQPLWFDRRFHSFPESLSCEMAVSVSGLISCSSPRLSPTCLTWSLT